MTVGIRSKDFFTNRRLFSICMLAGCSWAAFFVLGHHGFEGAWYRIHDVMTLTADHPYQHRMLFVWVAQLLQALFPFLTDMKCFYLSQIPPILLSFYMIKKWGELFIGKDLAFIAQLILTVMLIPTFGYYTFYDVAIVFFYTICLKTLLMRQFVQYLIFFTIGTLNHELTLFLLPLFVVLYFDGGIPKRQFFGLILAQLAAYAAVRGALFYFIPAAAAWQPGRIWVNLDLLLHQPRPLLDAFLTLGIWYLLSGLGFKSASIQLKRCVILLPLLLLMVLVFGQLNESRHFNAFIPVAIALILTFISAQRRTFDHREEEEQSVSSLESTGIHR